MHEITVDVRKLCDFDGKFTATTRKVVSRLKAFAVILLMTQLSR